jgi:hypothetical protein
VFIAYSSGEPHRVSKDFGLLFCQILGICFRRELLRVLKFLRLNNFLAISSLHHCKNSCLPSRVDWSTVPIPEMRENRLHCSSAEVTSLPVPLPHATSLNSLDVPLSSATSKVSVDNSAAYRSSVTLSPSVSSSNSDSNGSSSTSEPPTPPAPRESRLLHRNRDVQPYSPGDNDAAS